MPDWPTIQAAAASTNCKIIIRKPIPARESGSAYYFQLNSTYSEHSQYILLIPTDQGEPARFHRFFAKDNHKSGFGSSRLYNSILGSNWGFFLPERNGQWYEYLTVPRANWEFDTLWVNPKSGPISADQLAQDSQAIWGTKIPVRPTIYDTDSEQGEEIIENPLEEDDIFDSSHHLIDPVVANNLLTHTIAGTASASLFSETLNSIFGRSPNGNSTNSLESPDLNINQVSQIGQLIDISAITPSDDTSIPPGQKQPADINSPVRPESDEWLQPPLAQANLIITPEERPTTLALTNWTRNVNTFVASTPMDNREDQLALLHQQLAQQGYRAGSSQFPITTDPYRPTEYQGLDPRALSDERVRELGILDAQYINLESAVIRNSNKQSDGRPPIIFTCNKIQSPSPDLVLTEDLLNEFNKVALEAMTKLGNLLIGAQLQVMKEIATKRQALLKNWNPNEQEIETAKRIEASRTHKETTYKPRPIQGGRPTFRLDIQDNGPSFMPSSEPTSTSGFRPPGNKNIPRPNRPRQPQSPPREPAPYNGTRPKNPNYRARPEQPTRTRYENQDDDEDRDEPRYDKYRRTRYLPN
jgi:hypothetical protein